MISTQKYKELFEEVISSKLRITQKTVVRRVSYRIIQLVVENSISTSSSVLEIQSICTLNHESETYWSLRVSPDYFRITTANKGTLFWYLIFRGVSLRFSGLFLIIGCLGIVWGVFCIRIRDDKRPFRNHRTHYGQADQYRCFYGTIKRLTDEYGRSVVFGKINVLNGFICTMAAEDDELGWKLDEMVRMVLGYQYIA